MKITIEINEVKATIEEENNITACDAAEMFLRCSVGVGFALSSVAEAMADTAHEHMKGDA